ncbi:MAG TPA: PilZ domain-containing protein [bacterium]|jgi:hypothetical protein|nr:PilZ domain-containing protein [bacterium]
MKIPKKIEKRGSVRTQVSIPVKYRVYGEASKLQKSFVTGHSRDISVGGLKLAVKDHDPIGTELELEIMLPRALGMHTSARVIGKVVGLDEWRVDGTVNRFNRISFVEPDKDAQVLILRLMFELMKQKQSRR